MKNKYILLPSIVICFVILVFMLQHEDGSRSFFRELSPEVRNFSKELKELTIAKGQLSNSDDAALAELEFRTAAFYHSIDSALTEFTETTSPGIEVPWLQLSGNRDYEIMGIRFNGCNINHTGSDILSHFTAKLKITEGCPAPLFIQADFTDEENQTISSGFFYQSSEDPVKNNACFYKCNAGEFDKMNELYRIIFK